MSFRTSSSAPIWGTASLVNGGSTIVTMLLNHEDNAGDYVFTIIGAVPLIGSVTRLGTHAGGALARAAGVGSNSTLRQADLIYGGKVFGRIDNVIGLGTGWLYDGLKSN